MTGPARRATGRRRRERIRRRSDEGSGSVLTLAIAGVLVVLAVGLGLQVQATVARTRAQLVADLSALAAAREVQRGAFAVPGAADPCTLAAALAAHNGGRLTDCEESAGGRVHVAVVVRISLGDARAFAVAGPRS